MIMGILEQREKGGLFFLWRQVYFIVFFTAEESRINTDEPYVIFFSFFFSVQEQGKL